MAGGDAHDGEPRLPLVPGPVSNGEFVPAGPTARDRWLAAETMARSAEAADRAGIDRRRFLQSAAGVATLLGVCNLAACSSGSGGRSARRPSTTAPTSLGTSAPGGSFTTPPPEDARACEHALGGEGEFIFDMHTHHVMPDRPWRNNAPETLGLVLSMLPPGCQEADQLTCADRAAYVHDLFLASDTTVAMLTDVPESGPDDAPIPFDDAVGTQAFVEQLTTGGAGRVLLHNVIAPNVGDLRANLDHMEAVAATGHLSAFKVYPAWNPVPGAPGFALDDPALGLPVVQKAHDVGMRRLFAHKGLPLRQFDATHNGPDDMVAVSRIFPDMQFVIFHAAWDPNYTEGPYDPGRAQFGINAVIRALDQHQVPPNSNVWVDLGTTWRTLLTDPEQAAHALGKLLSRVGQDRVLWGTDAIWYGSPQPQIMAFRAFEISAEYQERFGYPALTDDVKRKVLGLNAAALLDVDAEATRCAVTQDGLDRAKAEHRDLVAAGALPAPWQARGPITRRQALQWFANTPHPWTPG